MKKVGILSFLRKSACLKFWSMVVCFALMAEIFAPGCAYALTSGPSQPEVQSFEPVETSKMVDLPTGDFTYNIPLLEVDGYPVNISYHSGVTMDQEASWVGLGWNINPGVINRNLRGIPDDFSGDVIKKNFNMKDNETYAIGTSMSMEVYGCDAISLGFSLGGKYNNYNGIGIIQGMNISVSSPEGAKGSMNGSLGISLTNSTEDGLSVGVNASFSAKAKASETKDVSMGANVGIGYNSRSGLGSLTAGVGVSLQQRPKKVVPPPVKNEEEKKKEDPAGPKNKGFIKLGLPSLKNQLLSRGLNASSSYDFGTPTYSPSVEHSMKSFSIAGRFTLGGEIYGMAFAMGINGSYSKLSLASKETNTAAYGYMYSAKGQSQHDAILDFNREKDVPFTGKSENFALTNFTFDTYSVSGQGIGGSYRPFRGDFGYVFDAKSKTTSDSYSIGLEIGIGNTAHSGADMTMTDVSSKTGVWTENNDPANRLYFRNKGPVPKDYEEFYFKEANEKTVESDPAFFDAIGGFDPQRFELDKSQKFNVKLRNTFVDQNGNTKGVPTVNFRKKRAKRNQTLSVLKHSEYADFAVEPQEISGDAKPHHIAEYTTTGMDGSRYIYGFPVYNLEQREVTFAIGNKNEGETPDRIVSNDLDYLNGLIAYTPGEDNSSSNKLGKDNYFSSIQTPPYAYSYLLTSILSSDYVDNDAVRGPSENDLGSYTRLAYERENSEFKWRTPVDENKASYNEGLKSNTTDDKACYVYGVKELIYLQSIEGKNFKAIFYNSPRNDGHGVYDMDGGVDNNSFVYKLDSIALFSKSDIKLNGQDAVPLKTVIFYYDYSLCKNVLNNDEGFDPNSNILSNEKGKLTLRKIVFSYQSSFKARLSPYEFSYNGLNPDYCIKNYDRWGNYKPSEDPAINNYGVNRDAYANANGYGISHYITQTALPIAEFPYTEQNKTNADSYSSAWNLTNIDLPSGGSMEVSYESDDYAYVQDKRAAQMIKVIGYSDSFSNTINLITDLDGASKKLYFKLNNQSDKIEDYFEGIDLVYFRFLMNIKTSGGNPCLEYVPGYAKISSFGTETSGGIKYGYVIFESVELSDGGTSVNPAVKAAIHFSMAHLPKLAWNDNMNIADGTPLGIKIIKELWSSSVLKGIIDAVKGPNEVCYSSGVGQTFVPGKSWIRLNEPNKNKFGGGCRVKKIEMFDNWGDMVDNPNESFNYGQEYNYELEDGSSSGVATYEPLIGGDENPLRKPFYTNINKVLVPDDRTYVEEPFGESFFPAASVVYSRVTVSNLSRQNVVKHATGRTVSEFYTARDFPTITKRTGVDAKRDKPNVLSIGAILKFLRHKDYYTGTQGFCIELNDMAGKPKSQATYPEDSNIPISKSEYIYKKDPYLPGSYRLNNLCKVIHPDGNVSEENIGVNYDFVADMRESKTDIIAPTVKVNLDCYIVISANVSIPMIWPGYTSERTVFRSGVTTKVIQRFGILEEIKTTEDGSVYSVKNLAYDSETGETLLTQTNNNFNDIYYTLNFPAYWYYKNMGQAAINLGLTWEDVDLDINGIADIEGANKYFIEGDELAMSSPNGNIKGWVKEVGENHIVLITKAGKPVFGVFNVKVIRSGNRNMISASMAQIITSKNPLNGLRDNIYEQVIQSSAQEYSNIWKTYCDCILDPAMASYSENPFVLGTNSYWKLWRSYAYLTQRSQSRYNNNTNIRTDGAFTSYNPFYKNINGKWTIDYKNWTFGSEVTEFSPSGFEIENKDALGRYSAATYGYNQSLVKSVASNSRYRETGYDGFEDYGVNSCADNHFRFKSIYATNETAHTGKYSIKVMASTEKSMSKELIDDCPTTPACDIKFEVTSITTPPQKDVKAIDGTPPYMYEWNVLSGSPVINLKLNGMGIEIKGGPCQVEVTVTDSKGCVLTDEFEITSSN